MGGKQPRSDYRAYLCDPRESRDVVPVACLADAEQVAVAFLFFRDPPRPGATFELGGETWRLVERRREAGVVGWVARPFTPEAAPAGNRFTIYLAGSLSDEVVETDDEDAVKLRTESEGRPVRRHCDASGRTWYELVGIPGRWEKQPAAQRE